MRFVSTVLAASLALTLAMPAHADEAALAAQIQKLADQVEALKAELDKLKTQAATTPPTIPTTAAPAAPPAKSAAAINDSGAMTPLPSSMAGGSPFAKLSPESSPLTIFGYGEVNYENYPKDRARTHADLARAVIGFG